MKEFKLISLLLQYPDGSLCNARAEIAEVVAGLKPSRAKGPLKKFCEYLQSKGPVELQQHYVETFDFNKKATLLLSFHGYGDRRQRGAAMVRLKQLYRQSGLTLNGGELPDYLPAMLEYAAYAPGDCGTGLLGHFRAEIELVRAALQRAGSPYAMLLDATTTLLPRMSEGVKELVRKLASEGPPAELVGVEPFGPPEAMPQAPQPVASGCGVAA